MSWVDLDADNFALVAKNHRLIGYAGAAAPRRQFPGQYSEDIADEMGFDIRNFRQRDPKFRQMASYAYNYQCAICGFNMRHDNAPIALKLPISDGSSTMAPL